MKNLLSAFLILMVIDLHAQATLVYGPYLQRGAPTSMLVSWRTSQSCDSKLSFGTSSLNLNTSFTNPAGVTTHTIQVTGLNPNTKYYYTVSNAANSFTCDTFYFYTAPVPYTNRKIRFVATGDCGTGQATQANVKSALMNYIGGRYINGWLLLGDNAYYAGADNEYTTLFFGPYQNNFIMHHTALFPCPGNHEYNNDLTLAESKYIAYYDVFDSPTAAQLGGVASNSKSYYSYNYGNVHFISLDSYGTESGAHLYDTTTSLQYQWLKQDLDQNTSTWTIVYFHHPPYTMGSHNSDAENDLALIRQNLTPLFESKNVDVVLNGHSHNYERSWLIKGHTGSEATFSKTLHATDTSSAHYDGTPNSCPYIKDSLSNKGVVYAVCGSSGWVTTTQSTYPHDAMYYSNTLKGMAAFIEVDSNRLDLKFIGEDSLVKDRFTIFKNVNKKRSLAVLSTQTVSLKASWNGNYSWTNNGATTKQNSFTAIANTILLVRDSLHCIADTFKISVFPAGIKLNSQREMKVYPNPAMENKLIIEMEEPWKVKVVKLIDVSGIVFDIPFSITETDQLLLKIPDLKNGAYILKIETKDNVLNQKLILGHK
jgi:hypothetical protein